VYIVLLLVSKVSRKQVNLGVIQANRSVVCTSVIYREELF